MGPIESVGGTDCRYVGFEITHQSLDDCASDAVLVGETIALRRCQATSCDLLTIGLQRSFVLDVTLSNTPDSRRTKGDQGFAGVGRVTLGVAPQATAFLSQCELVVRQGEVVEPICR